MNIELRIDELEENVEFYRQYLDYKYDILSIGSEGCLHKLPSETEVLDFYNLAIIKKQIFKIVIPKIPQKHIHHMISYIEKCCAISENIELVVNDLGFLNIIKKRLQIPNKIYLGRGISRSFEDCMWHDYILRNECEYIKNSILQNNISHGEKLELFSEYDVKGIESNPLKNQREAFKRISYFGWDISVHYSGIFLGVSRACQTAKEMGISPPECKTKCKGKIIFKMDKIWHRNDEGGICYKEVPDIFNFTNIDFYMKGNRLFAVGKITKESLNTQVFDNIIVNLEDINFIKQAGGIFE